MAEAFRAKQQLGPAVSYNPYEDHGGGVPTAWRASWPATAGVSLGWQRDLRDQVHDLWFIDVAAIDGLAEA